PRRRERPRARDREPQRGRRHQPGYRAHAVPVAQDGRATCLEHPGEARGEESCPACGQDCGRRRRSRAPSGRVDSSRRRLTITLGLRGWILLAQVDWDAALAAPALTRAFVVSEGGLEPPRPCG